MKIVKVIAFIVVVVIALGFVRKARATLVNSNSIVQDDIEYYIQTDKAIYDLGENVEMLYRITNLGIESVTYTLGARPIWNFWAETNGQRIWTGVYGKLDVITSLTLEPGEFAEFPEYSSAFTWDLRDDDNIPVQPGEHLIIGGLDDPHGYYDYTKVCVPINVIPEPGTLVLLGASLPFLRSLYKEEKVKTKSWSKQN